MIEINLCVLRRHQRLFRRGKRIPGVRSLLIKTFGETSPQIPIDLATNQLVAKFSRLYAQAAPEDQVALRVWMRDIILGRKVGANTVRARRSEKRMVEASERRILEFPLDMPATSAKPKPARNRPGVFMSASRTSKACWPPQLKKISSACSIIRKPSLNFSQSAWILLGHRRPLHLVQVESSK